MSLSRTQQRDINSAAARSFAASKQDQEARRIIAIDPTPDVTDGTEDITAVDDIDLRDRTDPAAVAEHGRRLAADLERQDANQKRLPARDLTDVSTFIPGVGSPSEFDRQAADREFAGLTESGRLVRLMNATKSTVSISEQLDRAQREYRAAEAREYRTAAGREAILAELEAPLRELEAEAQTTAREAIAFVDAAERRGRVVAQDLTHRAELSDAEMASASARLPFLRDDIARRTMPELARQIRAAIATNDYPSLFVFARYAGDRLIAQPAAAPGKVPFPVDSSGSDATELRAAIADATEALDARRSKTPAPASLPNNLRHELAGATKAIDRLGQRLNDRPGPPTPTYTMDGQVKVPWPTR